LLQTIAARYAADERVLAVVLFGSLGRGGGDAYSDLDLAVILRDGALVDVLAELEELSVALAAQGDAVLLAAAAGEDGYLVPQSLCGIAIDYAPLAKVSPYVLQGCLVIAGTLDAAVIQAAAAAHAPPPPDLGLLLHKALWLALGADVPLQRGQFWQALPSLEKMRGALLDIFAASRGGQRAYHLFAEAASAALQAKFGRTLPSHVQGPPAQSVTAAADALAALVDLVEYDLDELSSSQLQLGPGERELLARLRARQAALRG
jgi:predicted nucleotidyltransferase